MLSTHDLMGIPGADMLAVVAAAATCHAIPNANSNTTALISPEGTYLIAPLSATFLDAHVSAIDPAGLRFEEVWRHRRHLNLDDLDFADDGVWATLKRVVGRRGLVAWRVTRECGGD